MRLIALLIVAVFVATLIESSTVTRVEALNTTLTVNSDLPHILLKGSPLSDGDCDTIPESLRSILHPPPNTCTLGGALRQLGAIAGHHTIFFSAPVVAPAGFVAEFVEGGSVTIEGPVTIDMSDGFNATAIHVKDLAGIIIKDVWIKGPGSGESDGITISGTIPVTTVFPCTIENVVMTGVTTPLSIATPHICDIADSRFGIDPDGNVVSGSGDVVISGDEHKILRNSISTSVTVVGDDVLIRDNRIGTDLTGTQVVSDRSFGLRVVGDRNVLESNVVSANGGFVQGDAVIVIKGDENSLLKRGYVNRCVNDIRRRPSQPLIQWRFHPHTVHRDRRLRSTQGPSDA